MTSGIKEDDGAKEFFSLVRASITDESVTPHK
jgi:hypothetical protein